MLLVPQKLDEKYAKVECRASASTKKSTLFWFLDGQFLQKTNSPHKIYVDLDENDHKLLINDSFGNRDEVRLSAVKREITPAD